MKKIILMVSMVITLSIFCFGCGSKGISGTYTSEDGIYSVKFSSDSECTWYQDDLFFNGTYEKTDSGYQLEIVGDGFYTNTVFTVEADGEDLIISGGIVENLQFIKE